ADLSGVSATTVDEAPIADADLVVLAVPSRAFAEVAAALPGDAPVLSLTKGLDPATGERLSTRVQGRPVAVLSGPNMAEEIADGLPSATVIASEDHALAEQLQEAINSMIFRVYVNDDLVGVELCAAAKNVIALAAGGVDGLGLGDNAKASLITRGLVEMARLGEAEGAQPETFSGLAGMGDLIVTCFSGYGRNRRAGELVARAKTHDEAKLRRLATSFDKGGEHYTVQSISGWSVVADSQQAFAQVKATGSGKSLADNASFRAAEATLNGNSLATAFLN